VSSSIVIPSMDPRNERRTGSAEGLARRVAELERRVAKYERGVYVPAFWISGSGGFSTSNPPNSTSGNAFTVPMAGTYICRGEVTVWATASGMQYVDLFVDANIQTNCEKYGNDVGNHQVLHSRWFSYNFSTAGNHYLWHKQVGAVASDGNDRWSFMGFRIMAQP
jgi:hypothetical protein